MLKQIRPKSIKDKAVALRKNGFSLSEIFDKINVPKSTVQHWIKHIELTRDQKARLKEKEIKCGMRGLAKARKVRRDKIEKRKEDIRKKAAKFKNIFVRKSNMGKLVCGILYLCEGARYPSSRQMIFGNSDPRTIKIFLDLLRANFAVDEKKFRCRIMHRYDQDGNSLNRYWSAFTKIPPSQFYRSYKDKRTKGKVTKKKDYKGICAIQYNSTWLQYELLLIGESIYS